MAERAVRPRAVQPRGNSLNAVFKSRQDNMSPKKILLATSLLIVPSIAPDPSGGWLAYAIYEAPKASDIITSLSAVMSVPDNPKRSGAEPAFWFGVQTHAGDGALVQPIQAKWLSGRWEMFHEIFDWTTHRDSAGPHFAVPAGDSVWAEVKFKPSDRSYDMSMTSLKTGQRTSFNYKLSSRQYATESTAYFVLEHQPRECSQLPPNGIVTWSNISVEVNNVHVPSPTLRAKQESPACGSKVHIVDNATVTLTWDTSAPSSYESYSYESYRYDLLVAEEEKKEGFDLMEKQGLVRVPGGHIVPRACLIELTNRGRHNASSNLLPYGCAAAPRHPDEKLSSPHVQIYAADVQFESTEPLTSFTADWVVPRCRRAPIGRSSISGLASSHRRPTWATRCYSRCFSTESTTATHGSCNRGSSTRETAATPSSPHPPSPSAPATASLAV